MAGSFNYLCLLCYNKTGMGIGDTGKKIAHHYDPASFPSVLSKNYIMLNYLSVDIEEQILRG